MSGPFRFNRIGPRLAVTLARHSVNSIARRICFCLLGSIEPPFGAFRLAPPAFRSEPPDLVEIGSEQTEPATWDVAEDADGTSVIRTYEAATTTLPDGVSTLFVDERLEMRVSAREPGRGRFWNECAYRLERDGRTVDIRAEGTTVASETAFEMDVSIRVDLDGDRFFERFRRELIPRDLL